MSTHQVTIFEVESVLPHSNADALEIVPVNGWQAIVRKGDFTPGKRAIFIEPDYIVPTDREYFKFLAKAGKTHHRLKAAKLRGVVSFGLIISVPQELQHIVDGVAMMEALGVIRYEPAVKYLTSNELPHEDMPNIFCPKFDIESFKNYPKLIPPETIVYVTEKIHGANARYLWADDRFYIGSRNRWIKPEDDTVWKAAVDTRPEILTWCKANPETVLFGEIFGKVQSLTYGSPNSVHFVGFAALSRQTGWIKQADLFLSLLGQGVSHAPLLYHGPLKDAPIATLCEEDSSVPNAPKGHMREGVVVVPEKEEVGPSAGRMALKQISDRYWLSEH